MKLQHLIEGAQWLSGRVLDLIPRGSGFEPHRTFCGVSSGTTLFVSVLEFPIENGLTAYDMYQGAQWLSGRVLDSRPRGRRFEPHRRHYVVSLSKTH